ncbi:MAG: HEPN domain-containing protein [Candidatus Omnitrophica bacterium]|nr:HEPN domain-containing protein [Candidatus Omnitrophota bacterium]MBU1871479.1 HEPN domain-containing protein [Candidatus Omnitrophota bacterium]
MTLEYDDCLKRGKIKPFTRGKSLVSKELETAVSDLERARKTYKDGDYKWATIQIYYSMFHGARALLYAKNLREHSHFCLIATIKTLYVETKQLSVHFLEGLQEAKNLREDADYYNRWSRQGCEKLLKLGDEFLQKVKEIIKK